MEYARAYVESLSIFLFLFVIRLSMMPNISLEFESLGNMNYIPDDVKQSPTVKSSRMLKARGNRIVYPM